MNTTVFADLVRVGALSTFVKVLGAVKVAVTAAVFGASGQLDAYFIAFLIPSLFADVLAGSISAALVPSLVRVRLQQGQASVVALYQNVLAGSVMLLSGVAAALAAVAVVLWPALSGQVADERVQWIYPLVIIMLPVLPLVGANIAWRALLHTEQRFAVVAAAPCVTPLLSMGLLLAFGSRWGVYVLAAGTLAGTVLETCILAATVRARGYPVMPLWTGFSPEVRDVVKNCYPFVAGTSILSGAIFVDQSFAILLGPGSVAILNYGTKLTTVLLAIGGASVGSVYLPFLSRLAAADNWPALRRVVRRSIYVITILAIPATAILIWQSETLVRLYLQRGSFSAEMASEVARVQRFSLVQIPLGISLALVLRLMAALRVNRLLLRVAVASLVVNAIADAVLMRVLGTAGIAAADSVAALVTLVLLAVLLARHTAERSFISPATSSV